MPANRAITPHAVIQILKRLAELDGAKGRCRICFGTASDGWPLEVHHATYERLGCEAVGDLLAICGDCHREVTSFLRGRRYARHTPLRADVVRVFCDPLDARC